MKSKTPQLPKLQLLWRNFVIVFFLLPAFSICAGELTGTSTKPTISLVSPVLKLENGASDGQATMVLRIEEFDKSVMANMTTPKIEDLNVPNPPSVDVKFTLEEVQPGPSSRSWLVRADIKGLPGNTSEQRYLSVTLPGFQGTLDYTLTNKYTVPFSWTLKSPPSAISIQPGQPIEIGVAVGPVPASNVRLLQAALIEQSRKFLFAPTGMKLCQELDDTSCNRSINLAGNSANRLWLKGIETTESAGQFTGIVTIASSEKPEGDSMSLTVAVTNPCSQLLGIILVLVGVIGAWTITVYGRSRLNRDELLRPAALLIKKLQDLRAKLNQVTPTELQADISNIKTKIDQLNDQLSVGNLDEKGYLPRPLPSPFAGSEPKLDEYRKILQSSDDWAMVLKPITEAIANVWAQLRLYPDARTNIIEAVNSLDLLTTADLAPSLIDINKSITSIWQQLLAELQGRETAEVATTQTGGARTYEQLNLEIRFISLSVWLVMGALATLLGTYIVVLSNLGFGLSTDYLLCVFWGFGLPVGGQQLLQLTSSSATTALGISITK